MSKNAHESGLYFGQHDRNLMRNSVKCSEKVFLRFSFSRQIGQETKQKILKGDSDNEKWGEENQL